MALPSQSHNTAQYLDVVNDSAPLSPVVIKVQKIKDGIRKSPYTIMKHLLQFSLTDKKTYLPQLLCTFLRLRII